MQGAEERQLRRMSNTPQGGANEGNTADDALPVNQGSHLPASCCEPHKRAHSPLLAAGLASESQSGSVPYGRRSLSRFIGTAGIFNRGYSLAQKWHFFANRRPVLFHLGMKALAGNRSMPPVNGEGVKPWPKGRSISVRNRFL
jgi:hypothetical protein